MLGAIGPQERQQATPHRKRRAREANAAMLQSIQANTQVIADLTDWIGRTATPVP